VRQRPCGASHRKALLGSIIQRGPGSKALKGGASNDNESEEFALRAEGWPYSTRSVARRAAPRFLARGGIASQYGARRRQARLPVRRELSRALAEALIARLWLLLR